MGTKGILVYLAIAFGGSLTTILFLGSPNWIFVNYSGILAWIPLGIVCGWIVWSDFNASSWERT
jgi:hypothetical protein